MQRYVIVAKFKISLRIKTYSFVAEALMMMLVSLALTVNVTLVLVHNSINTNKYTYISVHICLVYHCPYMNLVSTFIHILI